MKLVIIESPFAAPKPETQEKYIAYARAAMRDSIMRGEAPIASHLLYTQEGVLNDLIPEERRLGISCGFWWGKHAELVVFYGDYGMSPGMEKAKTYYTAHRIPMVYRKLYTENMG